MTTRPQAPEAVKNYVRNLKCNKALIQEYPQATFMKSTLGRALNILIKHSKHLVIIILILRPASILMNFNFVNKSRSRPLPTLDTKFCIIVKKKQWQSRYEVIVLPLLVPIHLILISVLD